MTLEEIGQTYEGRKLYVVKISSGGTKPAIFIDAGIHAREWIAPATALYIIHQLLEVPSNKRLFENVDWYILPVVNPDGYEYSHKTERLWRKNREPGMECYGTDGNRNYGFEWGGKGSSSDECSEIYRGTHAFSAAETAAIRDFVLGIPNIKLYLSLHSYAQSFLYPWGYDTEYPENYEELRVVAELAQKAIHEEYGTYYEVSSGAELYPAAGGSDDWFYGGANVKLSYTFELGGDFFIVDESEIEDLVGEAWVGIKAFQGYVERKFGSRLN